MATTIVNPLREGLRLSRTPEPSTIVIFGGSGDLAQRKLMPALYNLALQRLLPGSFSIVGAARQPLTDDQYRGELHDAVSEHSRTKPLNEEVWKTFAEHLFFVPTTDERGYDALRERLERLDVELGTNANRLFYLATPPGAYAAIVKAIGAHGLRGGSGWARIVVEKPLGHDQESGRVLTDTLAHVLP